MDVNTLRAFPHVGMKQAAVVLTECGYYDKVGLGPGADTHVIKCFNCTQMIGKYWKLRDPTNKVEKMCAYIPRTAGVSAK